MLLHQHAGDGAAHSNGKEQLGTVFPWDERNTLFMGLRKGETRDHCSRGMAGVTSRGPESEGSIGSALAISLRKR